MHEMNDNSDSSTLVLYLLGALMLGIGGAWLFLSNRDTVEPAPVAAVETPSSQPQEVSPFDALPALDPVTTLEMAELALQAGQVFEPEDASAFVFFDRVLAVQPDNARASEAMAAILDDIEAAALSALESENYARVEFLVDLLVIDYDTTPQFARLVDALSDVVDSKLAVVDGATRRGQWLPAEALLDEIAAIPTADPFDIAERRAALEQARAEAGEPAVDGAPAPDDTSDPAQLADAGPQDAGQTSIADEPASATEPVDDAPAETVPLAAETQSAEEPDEQESGDAADAPAVEVAAAEPEEVDPLLPILAQAVEHLSQGRLVTPPEENAHSYFREALRLDPGNAVATGGLRDIMLGLQSRALDAARASEWDAADRWLEQADNVNAATGLVADTRDRIRQMRIEEEKGKMVPVSQFNKLKIVRPRFPQRALRHEVAGWALLQFTIEEDGSTGDIEILETSDRFGDQFARAAENAVEKWRFEPRQFMGQAISARTQTRVTFNLAD